MTAHVILLRHAALPDAWAGRWAGGGSDPPADPTALRALSGPVARAASAHPPARVLSSPLARARATAALLGLPLAIDARLAERDFGRWEGRPVADCLGGVDPADLASAERYLAIAIPGAEPADAVVRRAEALWRELSQTAGTTWCVGHGGSLRALLAAACRLSLADAFRFSMAPGAMLALTAPRVSGGRRWRWEWLSG